MMEKNSKSLFSIILIVILFIYNSFKFIEEGGSNFPISNILFAMILLIVLLIITLHKKDT